MIWNEAISKCEPSRGALGALLDHAPYDFDQAVHPRQPALLKMRCRGILRIGRGIGGQA
jgi:hypothetical protein